MLQEVLSGAQLQTPSLRILLAEDSYANQRLAVGVLSKLGHQVTVANNGREAIEALEREPFDLVLMDVQMPEMDGYQATAVIREREARAGAHTPIVAMTAHAMKGDREECLAAGMDDYVAKPLRKRELQRVLDEIGVNRSGAVPQESLRIDADGSPLGPTHWDLALETADGDVELLREVLLSFLEETPGLLDQMGRALCEGNTQQLHGAAHCLRGNLKLFGPTRATALAERLEQMGKSRCCDGGPELLQTLRADVQAMLGDIRKRTQVDGSAES